MAYRPRYDRGDWKAICDICGRERKASELRQRWDGFMVCEADWEPRHPQDFVRGIADFQAPPFTRPEPADSFVLACTTRSSIPAYAIPGCAIPANIVDPGLVPSSSFTP